MLVLTSSRLALLHPLGGVRNKIGRVEELVTAKAKKNNVWPENTGDPTNKTDTVHPDGKPYDSLIEIGM